MTERAAFTAAGELIFASDGSLFGEGDPQWFPRGVVHLLDPVMGRLK